MVLAISPTMAVSATSENELIATLEASVPISWISRERVEIHQSGWGFLEIYPEDWNDYFYTDTEFEFFVHDPNRKLRTVFISGVEISRVWFELNLHLEYNNEREGFLFTVTVENILFESAPETFWSLGLDFIAIFDGPFEILSIQGWENGYVTVFPSRPLENDEVLIVAIFKDDVFYQAEVATSWLETFQEYYVYTSITEDDFPYITIKSFVWECIKTMKPFYDMAVRAEWDERFERWHWVRV